VDAVHAKYLLIKDKATGVDPLVDKILSDKEEDRETKLLYQKARSIYLSNTKKAYVEACFLASKDLKEISEVIEIPLEVLYVYSEIFFNVLDYDRLSLLEVVESCDNPEERGMRIWAMSQGMDFIRWRLGKAVIVNPVEGLQDLFTMCTYKAKEALFSGNATEGSKEGTKWSKLAIELARLLKMWTVDNDAIRKDLDLALASIEPDFAGFDNLDL
jgi:hypothetical protein